MFKAELTIFSLPLPDLPYYYGLSCILSTFIYWSVNPQYLRMQLFGGKIFKEDIELK